MCEWGNTVKVYVLTPKPFPEKLERVDVDECIAPLVKALNKDGIRTVASCCGHGNRPGSIALADGRELIIAPDYETAREVDEAFPDIHGET